MNNNYFLDLFERRLREYTGAPYVVLTDSCTSSIFLSLEYLKMTNKIKPGEDVVIPNHTYVSVPMQLIHSGFVPVFDDIKWVGGYQIGKYNLYDYATGLEMGMYNEAEGFQCLSFQQKKALPIGKGGAILLNDKEGYEILKRMSHDGRDSSIPVAQDSGIIMGWHMNMTPNQAAEGVMILNQLEDHPSKSSDEDYPDISKLEIWKKNL